MEYKKIPEARTPSQQRHFSEETLASLRELGEVIRKIHDRLVSEGYVVGGGKIYKPGENNKKDAREPR